MRIQTDYTLLYDHYRAIPVAMLLTFVNGCYTGIRYIDIGSPITQTMENN